MINFKCLTRGCAGNRFGLFYIASKTCLYGIRISENIEIEHVFQSKAFFHLSNIVHTSCHSAFKYFILG